MSTKFLSPGWRMPRNANQSKFSNYSMDFDGSKKIDCGAISQIPSATALTVSCWLNANSITTNQVVWGDDSSSYIFSFEFAGTANKMYFEYAPAYASIDLNSVITVGTWHHVVMVYDASGSANTDKIKFYIDGVDKSSSMSYVGSIPSSLSSSIGNFLIGFGNAYSNYFNGSIESVSIFDYALSSSQVTTLYGNSTNGVGNPMALPSPPIAYYPLGASAWNGEYLAENNAIGDYVFDFAGAGTSSSGPHINLGNNSSLNPSSEITVSMWIKTDSNSPLTASGYLDKYSGGGYLLDFGGSSGTNKAGIKFGSSGTRITSTTVVADQKWHNILFTCDNTTLKFYVDGNEEATASATIADLTSTEDLKIGGDGSSVYFFDGKISNVQIFNTTLSATEVETLYNYGSPIRTLANIPQSSNLKAWYKLDASEVYNSTSTEWTINNATSGYTKAFDFELNTAGSADEYISIFPNNELNGLTNVTFAGWFYARATNEYDGIFTLGSGTGIFKIYPAYVSGNTVRIRAFNQVSGITSYVNSNYVSINQWYHFAVVCESGSVLKIYINGQEETNTSGNNFSSIAQSTFFKIGSDGWNRNWNGLFSNFQVWDTGLSSTDAQTLYNNGSPLQNLNDIPQNSNLKAWWKLDASATYDSSTTTWTIPDDSNNSNVGISNAMTQANLVNSNVSTLNGLSSGMSQANLVQSDLQTVAPFSKYALDFDAASSDYIDCGDSDDFSFGDSTNDSPFSVSAWVKYSTIPTNPPFISKFAQSTSLREYAFWLQSTATIRFYLADGTNYCQAISTTTLSSNTWYHVVATYDGRGGSTAYNGINLYINGVQENSTNNGSGYTAMSNTTQPVEIGRYQSTRYFDGSISNASIWNAELTPAQVSELYNEGLPSDLNSHSAYSNLVSWWQLGENSSFDGNDWIVADEKGTNNGTSTGMSVGALVNGVGTTANGVSSGMSEGNLVGNAPYSTANALSTNMVVTSRVTGSGNTP